MVGEFVVGGFVVFAVWVNGGERRGEEKGKPGR